NAQSVYPLSISAEGRYVAFESYASNLVPGDTNGAFDIFVHRRPSFTSYCLGDGIDPNVTTPCPSGNPGAPGHGCASSINPSAPPSGPRLSAWAPPTPDTMIPSASGLPATVSCIYLQGDALVDVVFGDGVRCAGGTLIPLRTKMNSGGASQFPDSTETVTLSQ